jgi:flagellar biosynthetic protein FliO
MRRLRCRRRCCVGMMLQQILALFFVLALLGGALFLLRKKGMAQFTPFPYRPPRKTGEIKLVDRLPLGPQHSLVLVHVANEKILVGVSPSGCNRIAGFGALSVTPGPDGDSPCASC